jgi:PEP-CTERM motif
MGVSVNGATIDQLEWSRFPTPPGVPPDIYVAVFGGTRLWFTSGSSLGGSTDPWVIGKAETTAVPEPSTLALLGTAAATFAGYVGRRRRKRATPGPA